MKQSMQINFYHHGRPGWSCDVGRFGGNVPRVGEIVKVSDYKPLYAKVLQVTWEFDSGENCSTVRLDMGQPYEHGGA